MADTRLTHASVNDGCDTPSPRHFSCCSQSRHFSMPCFARNMQATDGLSSACANLQRLRCVLEDGRVQLGHILRDLDPVIVMFGRCHVVMQYECTKNARACTSMHEHVQCEQGCALRRWHTTHTYNQTQKHTGVSLLRQRAGLVANGRSNAGAAWVAIASSYAHAANAVRQRSHCTSQLPHDACFVGPWKAIFGYCGWRPDASLGPRDAILRPPARRPVASNGGEHWRLPVHHDCIRCPPPGGAGTSCRTASPPSPGSVCSCSLSARCQFLPDGSGLVAGGDLHREGAVA